MFTHILCIVLDAGASIHFLVVFMRAGDYLSSQNTVYTYITINLFIFTTILPLNTLPPVRQWLLLASGVDSGHTHAYNKEHKPYCIMHSVKV